VDASVGGKHGVNLDGFKNMVGVFRQPEFVICDTALLRTLPDVEIRSGFGEIIKHAAIASKEKFDFLVAHRKQALARDIDVINTLVGESVRIKAGVVNRDETERGERRKLNFGHTIGHAVERATGLAHGEAVSVGMRAAADLSVSRGLLDPAAARRLEELLADMGLPTRVDLDPDVVIDGILRDKKREQDDIQFVLLDGIGSAVVHPLPVETVTAFIKADACRG
jgi:3-dehydroquinate synthase